ncbi:MAG: histidine kinase, partial [Verrucomicrobia bacterium]|nr:histidine kinase [Verrucomicrobiota bacterium]
GSGGMRPRGQPESWLVTGWDAPGLKITALNEIKTPLEVWEGGGFYRGDGSGFFFGPVGAPTAYVVGRFTALEKDRLTFSLSAEMSGVRLDAGETRWGQQVVLLMEKPVHAMGRWAEWVAKTHEARTSKGALSGWNSWNFRTQKTTDSELIKVLDATERSGERLRPEVIQVDDAVEPARVVLDAPWRSFVANRVGEMGARFGLRLNFDRSSLAEDDTGLVGVTETIRRSVASGFSYLKVSCPRVSERVPDEKRTAFEVYRSDWAAIREAAGEGSYRVYAGGGGLPDRATVGSVDASRVASAASRTGLRKVIADVLPSLALQGRWFAVDPDVYYVAGEIENVCSVEGGEPVMQTWLSMVGLSCGSAITSEPFYWRAFDPYLRNLEVLSPPARERTDVLHLFTMPAWTALVGHVHRQWSDSTVALLFNAVSSTEFALPTHFDFEQAGLDPHRRYAVWSFWDNRFLGIAKGKWATPVLLNGHSQQLVFTDLDRTPDVPVLMGSNLHIYCGAAEIRKVASLRDRLEIDLTDAGARAGDLFFYSRWPLTFTSSTGCGVSAVVKVGENVWRVSITDRRRGVAQRLELAVVLPITRRGWFWLLVLAGLAGVVLAARQYILGLRLDRAHALERERSRIARDLHDYLGSGLTEIALLSEVVRREQGEGALIGGHARRIFQSASELTRALDEIVWAVNPANDTLEKLIQFIAEFAGAMLGPAEIRCRLDLPDQVPELTVTSIVRHQLCMALKECLHNGIKHSHASAMEIGMTLEGRTIRLTIADNGRGFDLNGLKNRIATHDGLDNLRRRMADIGGTCEIQSEVGSGTRVDLGVII